jgi:hypothetical protein
MHRAILADFRFKLLNVAHGDSLESYRVGNDQPGIHGPARRRLRGPELNFTANPGVYQVESVWFGERWS